MLRPAIMREEVSFFSANTKDSVPGVSPQLLHIKVISGQNFPKPKGSGAKGDVVDPYVYVEIHGIPADCAEQRTRTVHQNGDAPIFDESFEFQVNLPELAMVRFVVLDDASSTRLEAGFPYHDSRAMTRLRSESETERKPEVPLPSR